MQNMLFSKYASQHLIIFTLWGTNKGIEVINQMLNIIQENRTAFWNWDNNFINVVKILLVDR